MAYGKHSAPIQISPFKRALQSIFPTDKDNNKQLAVKISFLSCIAIVLCILIITAISLGDVYFQRRALKNSRTVWYNPEFSTAEKFERLREENEDFKAWLTVNGTAIDYPVYQSEQDGYYDAHNQTKRKSRYGSLHLYNSDILERGKLDSNLAVIGNNMKEGEMFGSLTLFRKLSFFNSNSTINFTTLYDDTPYVVFAVFLIDENADGYKEKYFNPYYSDFSDEATFNDWLQDAKERSIIKSELPILYTDNLLTLVTDADDFEGARLIVIARKLRKNEVLGDNMGTVNPLPRYPRAWYETKGLNYPY